MKKNLEKANLSINDIDLFEINEALGPETMDLMNSGGLEATDLHEMKEGEKIDLVTGLLNLIADDKDALDGDDLKGFTTIYLHELLLRTDWFLDNTKQYGFSGRVSWRPDIKFWSDDPEPLNIEASVNLAKLSGEPVTGLCSRGHDRSPQRSAPDPDDVIGRPHGSALER